MEALKLIAYGSSNPLNESTIEYICMPTSSQTVWAIGDCIGRGDAKQAIRMSALLYEQGENAHSLWNIFLWIVRNILTLWIWEQERHLSPNAVSKEAGIPFPSVRSLLPFVRTLDRERINAISRMITDAEVAVKTGGYKTTTEDGTELMTLLERCLLELSAEKTVV